MVAGPVLPLNHRPILVTSYKLQVTS